MTPSRPPALGLAGWSGSGKTTLLIELIPALIARGLSVSTLKHAHHAFDVDKPGKDSFRHREAGASEVLIGSAKRWALMRELREEDEPSLDALLARMAPVDLILVEGFKADAHPKIEVRRPSLGKPPMTDHVDNVIAIACDEPLTADRPVLDLNDADAIAEFICAWRTDA